VTARVFIVALAASINFAYAVIGQLTAKRYGIGLSLRRSPASWIVSIGTILECIAVALQHSVALQAMLIVAFGAVVTGAACDAACGYVFDSLTLPCALLLFALALATKSVVPFVLGAGTCAGSLLLLYALTRGRGLGLGDVKLACCIGGVSGPLGGLESLGAAFVLGGVYAAFLLVAKRATRGDELRFAPYLAAGMTLVLLYGAVP
jgi:leader peptidase (prepilin peptidase)/N-methyltransferase